MKVRAICFDLDNTLWDVWPVIMRAEQKMYDFLAQRYPRVVARMTIEMMRTAREQTAAAHPLMRHDFTFLRKQTLREHAREFGYAEAMVEEAFGAFIQARNEVDLYADVLPALEQLRTRYRLFTASNGNADLGQIGIAHFFERTIAARQVGALKPDPTIFHKVIEGTDLQAHEVVYVGDDPLLDVVGARGAGMQAIWIDRTGGDWPAEIEPAAYTVRSLTELTQLL
ncbi:MAG TPA: HAD family hydrolase [Paraburkholderia sp.]|uniref:HAD family hydrolase n=1 Tax=Paraburkholderia sp. TaxID=1926495 RepID=UPI002B4A0C0A|nr:HAD family hydrolase [Paraburkholderia sp.]HKR42445.1 HAD family hydrolase [Paraburkholderia sp.]